MKSKYKHQIKSLFLTLILIFLFILGIAFIMPDHYKIHRSIEIKEGPQNIFPWLADFSKCEAWSPWFLRDPKAIVTVFGTPQKVGHKTEWRGKIIGHGTKTITNVEPNKSMTAKIEFLDFIKTTSQDTWVLENNVDHTTVHWYNEGNLDYPIGRLFGPFLDQMLGEDFQHGLARLKSIIEHDSRKELL